MNESRRSRELDLTVRAETPGLVWKILVTVGEEVAIGQDLVLLESMKMEIPVTAPVAGRILMVHVLPDSPVSIGQSIVTVLSTEENAP